VEARMTPKLDRFLYAPGPRLVNLVQDSSGLELLNVPG
jgi:hypothetical protein